MGNDKIKPLQHLAIIMDGNGRWADQRGLERSEGHRAGAETVKRTIKLMKKFSIKYLTLYAFSSENWKRSSFEINALMKLLKSFLDQYETELQENNIRFQAIGRISDLPKNIVKRLKEVTENTANNNKGVLTLCLSYGGRAEIVDAARKIAAAVKRAQIDVDSIDEKLFAEYLYAPELPDPDLMIRTSGELRLSNFLLWQLSYSEFYVSSLLWPDFDEKELSKALDAYYRRDRRFGREKA